VGDAAAGGVGEHFLTEIRGDHLAGRALALDFQGQVAGARRDVERAGGMPAADPRSHDLAPPDVRAAAQDVVGQHIAIGNAGKGVADVNGIGHGGRLGADRPRIKRQARGGLTFAAFRRALVTCDAGGMVCHAACTSLK
jgi:hypothetical protein